jgi:hypothetical protein
MKKILSELWAAIVIIFISITGYKYLTGRSAKDVKRKVDTRNNEIGKMSTAELVALGNSIIAQRRNNRRK